MSIQRTFLTVFAFSFVLLGLFGFDCRSWVGGGIPGPLVNIIHMLVGWLALAAVMLGAQRIRLYARFFGILALLVSLGGFLQPTQYICNTFLSHVSGAWLYLGVACLLLWIGFSRYTDEHQNTM